MPQSIPFWNKKAAGYDKRLKKATNYAARLERAAAVFPEGAHVLDVGCATGEITLDLAPHCGRILGIDHAPAMAEAGNAKAAQRGVTNCRFEPWGAEHPQLAEGSFDAITNYSLLHLVDDAGATLKRFHVLLKPGGRLVTEAPCLGDWAFYWRGVLQAMVLAGFAPRVTCLSVADLEAMMRDAGFELVESKVYNPKSGQHCILARKAE